MKQEQRRSKPKADILVSARTGTIQFCGLTKAEHNELPCVTFMVHTSFQGHKGFHLSRYRNAL